MCGSGYCTITNVSVAENGRILVQGRTDYGSRTSFELVLGEKVRALNAKDSYYDEYGVGIHAERIGDEIHVATDGYNTVVNLKHFSQVIEALYQRTKAAVEKITDALPTFGPAVKAITKGEHYAPPREVIETLPEVEQQQNQKQKVFVKVS